jgi:integrase
VIDTKTEAGVRMFPIVKRLRKRLITHKLATGRAGSDLVFGRTASKRFVPSTVGRHARITWAAADLEPITLHEGRHSAATLGSYAGIGDLELTHIMGHSSVTVTKDIYGHVREEQVASVARVLDAYLESDHQRVSP